MKAFSKGEFEIWGDLFRSEPKKSGTGACVIVLHDIDSPLLYSQITKEEREFLDFIQIFPMKKGSYGNFKPLTAAKPDSRKCLVKAPLSPKLIMSLLQAIQTDLYLLNPLEEGNCPLSDQRADGLYYLSNLHPAQQFQDLSHMGMEQGLATANPHFETLEVVKFG